MTSKRNNYSGIEMLNVGRLRKIMKLQCKGRKKKGRPKLTWMGVIRSMLVYLDDKDS